MSFNSCKVATSLAFTVYVPNAVYHLYYKQKYICVNKYLLIYPKHKVTYRILFLLKFLGQMLFKD